MVFPYFCIRVLNSIMIYNPQVVLLVAVIFNILAVVVVVGILEKRNKLRREAFIAQVYNVKGLTYFPKFCSNRAILGYVVTLIAVSAIFLQRALPFQFMVFGLASVLIFFMGSNRLTKNWYKFPPKKFTKKLFTTALIIRVVYVVFIYFYYIAMTGQPHEFYVGDALLYHEMASLWRLYGMDAFIQQMHEHIMFSDAGYCWWLAIEYEILGTHVLPARLLKCVIDSFTCVLLYDLAERNFDEAAGRMAGVFYMLNFNVWFYCGVTLKEIEMTFILILFLERADMVLRSPKIKIKDMMLPLMCIIIMFAFRTALAAVMFAALAGALILTTSKQLQLWKKILYSAVFAIWMYLAVGVEIVQETQQLWAGRTENQEAGYQWRAESEQGNTFAKYATASVFAPLIFTIPFSSMVHVSWQENQMMMNGANFTKNIMSGFTIFALFLLLFRGDWRKHVLPLAVMCGYLVVLAFSNFAHSERFHFPVLGLELMFAAFGVTQMANKHKRWFSIWVVGICIANILWALIKLRGRGLA